MDYNRHRIHAYKAKFTRTSELVLSYVNMQNSMSLGPDGLGMCCNIQYI